MRYWHVYVTVNNPDPQKTYRLNKTFGVAADTLEAAIATVRAAHSDAEFWGVQHRGEINYGIHEHRIVDGGQHQMDRPN